MCDTDKDLVRCDWLVRMADEPESIEISFWPPGEDPFGRRHVVELELDRGTRVRVHGGPRGGICDGKPREGVGWADAVVDVWDMVDADLHARALVALGDAAFPYPEAAHHFASGERPPSIRLRHSDGQTNVMFCTHRLLEETPSLEVLVRDLRQLIRDTEGLSPSRSVPNPELDTWPADYQPGGRVQRERERAAAEHVAELAVSAEDELARLKAKMGI